MAAGQGAGSPADVSPPPPISREDTDARQKSLSASGEAAAADLYGEAVAQLDAMALANARADIARRQAAEAPGLLASISEELAKPSEAPKPEVPEGATLFQLEQGQAQATAQLNSARQVLADLQAEAAKRQDRRTQIPVAKAAAQERLRELDESLSAQLPETDPPTVTEARRTLLMAQRQSAAAELDALDAELLGYDARQELLPARRDRAARRVVEGEAVVKAWQDLVAARRRLEAEQAAREAERLQLEAQQHPVLRAFADESQQVAEARTLADGIPRKITEAAEDAAGTRTALNTLRQEYQSVSRRIEASGLNRSTGLLLRRQYDDELPDIDELRRGLRQTRRDLEEAEYTLIERQDARDAAGSTERVVQELMEAVVKNRSISDENRDEFEAVARQLATARRDLLGELVIDSTRYSETLAELEQLSGELLTAAEGYETFISERILWVKSITGNRWPTAAELGDAVGWFVSPESWSVTGERVRQDMAARFPTTIFAVLGLVVAFVIQRRCCGRIRALADLTSRYRTDHLSHTVRVILLTVIASVPVPALLLWLGWVLSRPTDQTELGVALGAGLRAGGLLLFPMVLVRQTIRRRGLADVHFRWSSPALQSIRSHLHWLTPIVIPAVVIVITLDQHNDEAFNGSLGRSVFTVGMVAFAVFIQRVLRPSGPVLADFLRRNKGGWADRLRYVWFPGLVGLPVALVAVSWVGYFYTALQLESRFESTIVFVLLLVLVNGVLMRWLFVARRRVAIEDARRRRAQAAADAKAKAEAHGDDEASLDESVAANPIDEDKLDLPAISLQTRSLFRTAILVAGVIGLYAIWADVLPALRMLDRVHVYPELRVMSVHDDSTVPGLDTGSPSRAQGESPSAVLGTNGAGAPPTGIAIPGVSLDAGQPTAGGEADTLSVTLADVGLSLVVLIATVISFRNLPGLIEIVILQRLPLDAGSRYALSTVLRYAIAIIGIVVAFGSVGLGWERVQWLAAALTFGLAFGLQEIFANFISGLIILGERPIRIGDTVTVGGVTGTVTRIRMRATTIADWDRKELVIPNKTFITGDVINWSLSDPILRVKIPVGVGYNEDVRLAERTLLRVAAEQKVVLKDPKPHVVFNGFGDSTLDFELRVFIPSIEHLIPVRHDLHMRIIEAFRAAGLEIAFPQRDLHIRSVGELAGLVDKRADLPAGEGENPGR